MTSGFIRDILNLKSTKNRSLPIMQNERLILNMNFHGVLANVRGYMTEANGTFQIIQSIQEKTFHILKREPKKNISRISSKHQPGPTVPHWYFFLRRTMKMSLEESEGLS